MRTTSLRPVLLAACSLLPAIAGCSCGTTTPVRPTVDAGPGGNRDGSTSGAMDAGPRPDTGPRPRDGGPNLDAFFAMDPPPAFCGPDGGMGTPPVVPGGTPECPDDKNREGCPCTTPGMTAACWPGLRVDRGRGVCRDGMTTCNQVNEFEGAWGPCEGYQLPSGPRGAEACNCFSAGQWQIDNLSPCFIQTGGQYWAISTTLSGGRAMCPTVTGNPPFAAPTSPWSPNRLRVDCSGRFRLCYTIKAGDYMNPMASDCTVAETCTEAWYMTPNEMQEFPVLPAWSSNNSQCATRFQTGGGYGEMSVLGRSVECDAIDDGSGARFVFTRVGYCPSSCNTMPNTPECMRCAQNGGGNF